MDETIRGQVAPMTAHWLPWFSIIVTEAGGPSEIHTRENLMQARFVGNFWFDSEDGRFRRFNANGRFVRDEDTYALLHEVDQHKDWTDADILAEVARRGVHYGPDKKAEIPSMVPVEALRELAGDASLELADVVFSMPDASERRGGLGAGALHWRLTYRPASGENARYVAHVEPFGGRLTSFSRYDSRQEFPRSGPQ